jgi:hypothetical protein
VRKEPLLCLRCHASMGYAGSKQFHEGGLALSFFLGGDGRQPGEF